MTSSDTLKHAIKTRALKFRARDHVEIIASSGTPAKWIFDMRAVLLSPEHLDQYAELFWQTYAHRYPFQVGGMETVGIALVAAIVMKGVERKTPVNGFFVRKSRKKEGLMKDIEGELNDLPIILVDDIINSGSTINTLLVRLDELHARVSEIFTILQFRNPETYTFAHARGIAIASLFSLEDFGLSVLRDDARVPKDAFRTLWRYQAPLPSRHIVIEKSAPILYEDLVLFGCDDGALRAINAHSGHVVWEFFIGRNHGGKGILSSPALHDGVVYFGGYDGNVYALDARTGQLRWCFSDADWVGSSPAIDAHRNRLYIGLEFGLVRRRGGIVALDLETGAEIWRDTTSALTHGSPLYIHEESMVVIGSNDHVLYSYDADTGTRKWTYLTGGDIKSAGAYDSKRRLIAVNSMDGKCHVLAARDGVPLYAKEAEFGMYSSPLIVGDTLFTASLDKTLYAVNLDTFKDVWRFETSGRIFSSPVVIEGSVWIGSNDGRLYEIDALSGAEKGSFQASERIVNAPVYSSRMHRYFVPTQANEIYCIERNEHR